MSPESDTDFGVDRRPRLRLTMNMPVHGGNELRFHCSPGWIFPTIDRQEPSGTDSRQGAILLIPAKQISHGGGSAVHQHLYGVWVLTYSDWAETANERVRSQTVGSRSPRIVASGWSV